MAQWAVTLRTVQRNTTLRGPAPKPSPRSQALVGAAGLFLRPLAEVVPTNRPGLAFTRSLVAASMMAGDTPRGVDVDNVRCGRVRGEWVRPRNAVHSQVILYLHGSGYAICSPRTHRGLVARLARYTRLPAFSVEYRLAPKYPYPAAADDVQAAFDWLIRQGYAPRDIVIAGDSAGGHLALDLIAENARTGREQPRSVVLFSPLLEMLRADAAEMTRLVQNAGGSAHLQIWPDQIHVFQAFSRLIPEARTALCDAAEFINTTPRSI